MTTEPVPVSKKALWGGYIMSALVVLLLLMSGVMKLMKPAQIVQGFAHYGYPESLISILGIVELSCAVIYIIPRTAVLGAILVTGYLGGAVATVARVGDSWILPALAGVLAWGGLFLRDPRVRALIPVRK